MQGGFKLGFANFWKKKILIIKHPLCKKGNILYDIFKFSQFIAKIPSHQLGKKLEKTNYFPKMIFAIMTNAE